MIEGLGNLQNLGENKKYFRAHQNKGKLATRKLYHIVGLPALRNLKTMIRKNIIHNFPIRVQYIEIAEKIFGPDVSTLKERTTIQR